MLRPELVKERIASEGLTQEEFANRVGVSQQVVSLWFKRDSIPAKYWDTIMEILNLSKGENVHEPEDNLLSIGILNCSASNGIGKDIKSIDNIESCCSLNIPEEGMLYSSRDSLVAIPVKGVSMLPTIMPYDTVVIDKNIGRYEDDGLYVMNFIGNMLVKRLQYDPTTGSIDIISDNPQFENYKMNLSADQSHFHIIGKVVATIKQR